MVATSAFQASIEKIMIGDDERLSGQARFDQFLNLLVFVLLGCWVPSHLLMSPDWSEPKAPLTLVFVLGSVVFYWGAPVRRRLVLGALFMVGCLLAAIEFPNTPNHRLLELVPLGLAGLTCSQSAVERRVFFSFIRTFALVVLFYAGVQKLLLGTYFEGQYLAYKTYATPSFQNVAHLWCSQAELQYFQSLPWPPYAGLTGFKLKTWYGLLISNLTWVLELVLPLLVVFSAKRQVWLVITLLFAARFQLAALEAEFFLMMLILLSLYFNDAHEKKLFGVVAVILAVNFMAFSGVIS